MEGRWRKIRTILAVALIAGNCFLGAVPAYANVDEAAVALAESEAQAQSTEAPAQTEAPVEQTEAPAEQTESEPVIDRSGTSFSVEGNAEVLDDISGDPTKEFYTIRTANNNTFYMVIDKSSSTENVYMLSMIDENDLKEFLGEETEAQAETLPSIVIPEQTEAETQAVPETENAGNSTGASLGTFAMIGGIAVAGIAAYYFLKIRPQKEEDADDSENLEMDDRFEMVNEDGEEA